MKRQIAWFAEFSRSTDGDHRNKVAGRQARRAERAKINSRNKKQRERAKQLKEMLGKAAR